MEKKMDPRKIRTRKLIIDAFIELTMKKDFDKITINDIASSATINRATFYYHFKDKYDLLDNLLREDLMSEILREVNKYEELSNETIESIFMALINFHTLINNQCQRGYQSFAPKIEEIIKSELQSVFTRLLQRQWPNHQKSELEVVGVMLSWAIYGATTQWMLNRDIPPEQYLKKVLPFIDKGMTIYR